MAVCNENNLYTHRLSGSVAPTRLGLSQILEEARGFVTSAALSELTRHQFLIVVEELATNIISHGNPPGSSTVDYEFCRMGEDVRICLSDSGIPFDPTTLQHVPEADAPSDGREGGWGWPVILKWCELESYTHENGRNHVALLLNPSRTAKT